MSGKTEGGRQKGEEGGEEKQLNAGNSLNSIAKLSRKSETKYKIDNHESTYHNSVILNIFPSYLSKKQCVADEWHKAHQTGALALTRS